MLNQQAEVSPRTRILIVANGGGAGRVTEDSLDEAMNVWRESGADCTLERPESITELRETVRHGRGDHDVVVIAGGDGTLHAALPALLGKGAPIGILPLGTANDLARTLGLPLAPAEAARVVASGPVRAIDVGRANDELFFNVAHIGVGARAHKEMTKEFKRRWRIFSYAIAMGKSLWNFRPFKVTIDTDGQIRRIWAVHVAVGNGRYSGGGVPVSADASIRDALLDVYCIRAVKYWRLFLAGYAVWRGESAMDTVWRASGKAVRLSTSRPHRVTADGEPLGVTPVSFLVEPEAVRVIVGEDELEGKGYVS